MILLQRNQSYWTQRIYSKRSRLKILRTTISQFDSLFSLKPKNMQIILLSNLPLVWSVKTHEDGFQQKKGYFLTINVSPHTNPSSESKSWRMLRWFHIDLEVMGAEKASFQNNKVVYLWNSLDLAMTNSEMLSHSLDCLEKKNFLILSLSTHPHLIHSFYITKSSYQERLGIRPLCLIRAVELKNWTVMWHHSHIIWVKS